MSKWRRKFLEKLEHFSVEKKKSQDFKVIEKSVPNFPSIDILELLVKVLINHTTSKMCVSNKINTDNAARLFLNIGCVITVIKVNSDYLSCLLIFSWADNYSYTKGHSKHKFGASFTDALTSLIRQ